MMTPLFTSAALVQNGAMYAPNLLKGLTYLLIMARFIDPRSRSSSVSSVKKTAPNKLGRPTMSFFVLGKKGLPLLIARTPHSSLVIYYQVDCMSKRVAKKSGWLFAARGRSSDLCVTGVWLSSGLGRKAWWRRLRIDCRGRSVGRLLIVCWKSVGVRIYISIRGCGI